MSITAYIPTFALESQQINSTEKLIFGIIFGFSQSQADCWITNKKLASTLGCEPRHIRRCIQNLVEAGLLDQSFEGNRRYLQAKGARVEYREEQEQREDIHDQGGHLRPEREDIYDQGGRTFTTDTNNINLSIKNEIKKREPHTRIVHWDKLKREDKLQHWQSVGKRPIKIDGAPSNIWLTEKEYHKARKHYEQEGIFDMFPKALQYLDGKSENNEKTYWSWKSHYKCIIGWLVGWAKEAKTTQLRLESTEARTGTTKVAQARIAQQRASQPPKTTKQEEPPPVSPEAAAKFKADVAALTRRVAHKMPEVPKPTKDH